MKSDERQMKPQDSAELKRSTINEFLRHPLLLTVVTFALTGILGSSIAALIGQQTKDIELARQETVARKTAIQNLSRYIYERRVRAELLASSVRRSAPVDELRERKRNYDDSYVRWNTDNKANLFLVRDILKETEYTFIESVIDSRLVSDALAPLDACITKAYDLALSSKNAEAVQALDQCSAKQLLQLTLDCGYAITDELYKLTSGATTQLISQSEINKRCTPPDKIR